MKRCWSLPAAGAGAALGRGADPGVLAPCRGPALCLRKRHTGVTLSVKAEGAILQRSGNTCVGSIALGEPLTPADPEISLRIYYAQAGEELFAIARRFHVSPAQMLAANDLAEGTTAIDAPRRLLVPGAGG